MTTTSERRKAYSGIIDRDVLEAVLAAVEVNRLQIILMLGERGPMCVGDIASEFRITRPAISHHLKVLKHAGLVQAEKTGQEVHYSIRRDRLVATLRALTDGIEQCCPPEGKRR